MPSTATGSTPSPNGTGPKPPSTASAQPTGTGPTPPPRLPLRPPPRPPSAQVRPPSTTAPCPRTAAPPHHPSRPASAASGSTTAPASHQPASTPWRPTNTPARPTNTPGQRRTRRPAAAEGQAPRRCGQAPPPLGGQNRRGPPRPGPPQTRPGEATHPVMTREEREKREHRERLRATFDQAAGLYDRARPRGTRRRCSTTWRSAPGTGQATLPLAERGGRVMAVELGPDLATRVGGRRPQLQRGARPVRPVRSRDVPGTGRLGRGCRR